MSDYSSQKIVNCDFLFKCPQVWDQMNETETDGVRFCGECRKNVYFAESPEALANFSREGKCIAVASNSSDFDFQTDSSEEGNFGLERDPHLVVTAGLPVRHGKTAEPPVKRENSEMPVVWEGPAEISSKSGKNSSSAKFKKYLAIGLAISVVIAFLIWAGKT